MYLEKLNELVSHMEVVEVSHYFEENMPVHPTHSKFNRLAWHLKDFGDVCNDYQILMNEHNGTHVDSFGHYIAKEGFELIDQINPENFSGICVTIDATFLGERETLEKEHILEWEKKYGEIRPGEIVLIDFGWEKYWDVRPNDVKFVRNYPGLGRTGAEYLVEKQVKMVGTDTLSIDADQAQGDPAHNNLLGSKIPIVENLCNLKNLYGRKGFFVMLPLLIKNGTASPVRPVVLVEK